MYLKYCEGKDLEILRSKYRNEIESLPLKNDDSTYKNFIIYDFVMNSNGEKNKFVDCGAGPSSLAWLLCEHFEEGHMIDISVKNSFQRKNLYHNIGDFFTYIESHEDNTINYALDGCSLTHFEYGENGNTGLLKAADSLYRKIKKGGYVVIASDVIAHTDESYHNQNEFVKVDDIFLSKNKLVKGSMKLIEKNEFESLKHSIKIEKIEAGGSVANTMAGISYLKGNASFIGKINTDEFGKIYKKSLEKINVNFSYIEKDENLPTGASIIFITPDSERTMCTYLGISSQLSKNDIDEKNIKDYEIIFLEGYLWDKGMSEQMFKQVINLAKKNNIKIAMSLSDIFCVSRHREDFFKLFINDLDILIGNENEINELMQKNNLLDSLNELKNINKLIIITRSENGSVTVLNNEITNCESVKVEKVLDLTGAGDLFAAGFLKEYLDKSNIKKCLQTGSNLAAKIIQKVGARLN